MTKPPGPFIKFLEHLTPKEANEFYDWICGFHKDQFQEELLMLVSNKGGGPFTDGPSIGRITLVCG